MCWGTTGAVVDDEIIPEGPLEVSKRVDNVMGNFKDSYRPPVRFVISVLKDGKIDYHNKIRLEKCTYHEYMAQVTKVVEADQLASILHWFKLNEEVKYVRLSFTPSDDTNTEKDRAKFFETIEAYFDKNFPKITFMDLSGSSVEEMSIDALEDKYHLRYPGH